MAVEEPAEEADAASDEDSDDSRSLPRVSSPALAELADDVAASAKDRDPGAERAEEEPVALRPPSPTLRPRSELTVKTVETVSPMDLVMELPRGRAGRGRRGTAPSRGPHRRSRLTSRRAGPARR